MRAQFLRSAALCTGLCLGILSGSTAQQADSEPAVAPPANLHHPGTTRGAGRAGPGHGRQDRTSRAQATGVAPLALGKSATCADFSAARQLLHPSERARLLLDQRLHSGQLPGSTPALPLPGVRPDAVSLL